MVVCLIDRFTDVLYIPDIYQRIYQISLFRLLENYWHLVNGL